MIDWARVADLRLEVGEEGFAEVVELFLEETDDVIARIGAGNPAQVLKDLHFLKGSALNLGLQALAQGCQEAERMHAGAGGADLVALAGLYRDSRSALQRGMTRPTAA